jgi:hypothetical protein
VSRHLKAVAALLVIGTSLILAVVVAVQTFPNGLSVLACVLRVAPRRGGRRFAGAPRGHPEQAYRSYYPLRFRTRPRALRVRIAQVAVSGSP